MLATLLTVVTYGCAQLSARLPVTPIPVVGTTFAVLLSGLLLGKRWGAVAQAQYLALGALGAPVFALGHGGAAVLFGITGGYLWSYPLAAFVAGWIVERGRDGKSARHTAMVAAAAGLAVIYTLGCCWFAAFSPQKALLTIFQGALIFLAWDIVKAMAAVGVASGLRSKL